ncbi:MAG: aminomethyl-transferring glycine dehydrogenase subunit GcvPA [Deltaproteobacteria bacterium]|nr:aminomethyl-transferring glycine dehydrogenase subunit GcvPA [Deltaproteobacteria bacterium]
MTHRYIPHSEGDRQALLEAIGCSSVEELFATIPAPFRVREPLQVGGPLSEAELLAHLEGLAAANAQVRSHTSFLGAGAYDHFIPSLVRHLAGRAEFYTAYTPYQPEISQGTLQAIFEFQTLICQLTGMDVANASLYDGASATAEAALMARRVTRRRKVFLARSLHPEYRQVVATYLAGAAGDLVEVPFRDGMTDGDWLEGHVDGETACVIVQSPNVFGGVEDLAPLADVAHRQGALLVAIVAEPISLGLLRPPGEQGADIVAGEGQGFGIPLSFGGPYLGFFATRDAHVRAMPGRLVGETVDREGRRGYVLTMATREQHIRREQATSNICTNEGLCALMATIYLATMGKEGLREVARLNLNKAAYARDRLGALPGFRLKFRAPTFNEFVLEPPAPPARLLERLEAERILGGVDLGRWYPELRPALLVCVTETHARADIDRLAEALGRLGRA